MSATGMNLDDREVVDTLGIGFMATGGAAGITAGAGMVAGLLCTAGAGEVVAVTAETANIAKGGVKLTTTDVRNGKQYVADAVFGPGGGIKHAPHFNGPMPWPPLPPFLH